MEGEKLSQIEVRDLDQKYLLGNKNKQMVTETMGISEILQGAHVGDRTGPQLKSGGTSTLKVQRAGKESGQGD